MASRPKLPRTVWILGVVSLLMDLSSEIYHALLSAFLTITLGLPVAAPGCCGTGAGRRRHLRSPPGLLRSPGRWPG